MIHIRNIPHSTQILRTLRSPISAIRFNSTGLYRYYDLATSKEDRISPQDDESVIKRQKHQRETPPPMVFDPFRGIQPPKYEDVFSDSNKSTQSSRRDVSYRDINKWICGVKVPKRPYEPDDCCMSGCVNCVWDLFNEDLQFWKEKTAQAVEALKAQGDNIKEKWPVGFDPPPKELPLKYIPKEIRDERGKQEVKNQVPIGIQVLQEFERKQELAKARRQGKQI